MAIALDQAVQPAVDTLAADSQAAAAQVAAVDSQAAQAAAVVQATAAAGAAEDASTQQYVADNNLSQNKLIRLYGDESN